MLRSRSLFWTFCQAKNRSLTAFSNFRKFLKIKKSLELLNMIFENSSLKGIFGQNMSDSPRWSLTDDSRSLQAVIRIRIRKDREY